MVESDDTAMKRYGMKRDVMDRYSLPGFCSAASVGYGSCIRDLKDHDSEIIYIFPT
jgi:hypothetical protein